MEMSSILKNRILFKNERGRSFLEDQEQKSKIQVKERDKEAKCTCISQQSALAYAYAYLSILLLYCSIMIIYDWNFILLHMNHAKWLLKRNLASRNMFSNLKLNMCLCICVHDFIINRAAEMFMMTPCMIRGLSVPTGNLKFSLPICMFSTNIPIYRIDLKSAADGSGYLQDAWPGFESSSGN